MMEAGDSDYEIMNDIGGLGGAGGFITPDEALKNLMKKAVSLTSSKWASLIIISVLHPFNTQSDEIFLYTYT